MVVIFLYYILFIFFFVQVWQEINEESKHVRDIMTTLESFQLDATPSKPTNANQDNDIWPVQVERRLVKSVTHKAHNNYLTQA